MDKKYIERKIENCTNLVETATSDAQREFYQGYLDLWTKKLPAKERPEAIAKREDAKVKKKAEELADAVRLAAELTVKIEAEELAKQKALEEKAKAAKIAIKRAELAALEAVEIVIDENTGETELFEESDLADVFELENAPKQAYRIQNGDKLKTIAFKEYLNQRTQ